MEHSVLNVGKMVYIQNNYEYLSKIMKGVKTSSNDILIQEFYFLIFKLLNIKTLFF